MNFTLIIILLFSWHAVAIDHISGFTSSATCDAAATQLTAVSLGDPQVLRTYCIQTDTTP